MKTAPFALRLGHWIIWNTGDWSRSGTIPLTIVHVERRQRPHPPFHMRWDGNKFIGTPELRRMHNVDRTSIPRLRDFLQALLKRPNGESHV